MIQYNARTCAEIDCNHRKRSCQILEAPFSTQPVQHLLYSSIGENRGARNAPLHNMTLNLHKNLFALGNRLANKIHARRNNATATGCNIVKRNSMCQQTIQHPKMGEATCATSTEGNPYCLMCNISGNKIYRSC